MLTIQPLKDWSAERDNLRSAAVPLVLLVERSDCPFCVKVREEVLVPLMMGPTRAKALFRFLVVDEGDYLIDTKSKRVTANSFVQQYDFEFSPTLLFLDENGKQISDALVGYQGTDFYLYYLLQGIEEATLKIAKA